MISEKKFIELLNLYLDHEISAEQVRVLEAEIRRDPARHTLYRQYCAMHRGCLELGSTFAAKEERAPELLSHTRELAQGLRRTSLGWGAWAGGVGLAAACGALAFFVFQGDDRSGHHLREFEEEQRSIPTPISAAPAVLVSAPALAPQAETQAPARASFASARAATRTVAPASSAVFSPAASAPVAPVQVLAATASAPVSARPAVATPAPTLRRLHPVYSPGFPRSAPELRFGQHSPFFYAAALPRAAVANGHLEWAALINPDAIDIARARRQFPSFQVQPAVAPSAHLYRRPEADAPEAVPHVEPLRFQFQR
ncbi:hypothetical protein AXK11_05740 [Cephaloticoccus primus]|uniref:Uncharacterized protein n=1 Tax=Cephaloticoccus primus TaxID=1548207 RepID=A0A139SMA4_9BACT|nr:hypothetical protein [Cephaloticoccus primus]KXU35665.1 hypothetical protein AXK11_05740 [Cephaloticoccus primus]